MIIKRIQKAYNLYREKSYFFNPGVRPQLSNQFVQCFSLKKTRQLIIIMRKQLLFLFFALFFIHSVSAQDTTLPYWQEVSAFRELDSANLPPKNSILFIGSSSFTKWTDVQEYFPGPPIINRAFGGSSLPDLINHVDAIVFPYKPRQIIIYCGENDLAASDTVSAELVFTRFTQLFQLIREKLPAVSIAFVSIKPSPSRRKIWPQAREANALIKKWLKTKKHTAYIDVYYKMFKNGNIMQDIFIEDDLHMNAKGYAIWQKAIEPYLLKK